MDRWIRTTDRLLRYLLIILISVLVACVTWQVSSRYLLGTPSTSTDEIGRFTLMWFALLSAAYVLGQRRHLAIDLFASMEPGPAKRVRSVILTLLVALMVIMMLVGGIQLVSKTLASGQVTPALRMPMGVTYLAVPVSAALMLAYCVDILRTALSASCAGPLDPVSTTTHTSEEKA